MSTCLSVAALASFWRLFLVGRLRGPGAKNLGHWPSLPEPAHACHGHIYTERYFGCPPRANVYVSVAEMASFRRLFFLRGSRLDWSKG